MRLTTSAAIPGTESKVVATTTRMCARNARLTTTIVNGSTTRAVACSGEKCTKMWRYLGSGCNTVVLVTLVGGRPSAAPAAGATDDAATTSQQPSADAVCLRACHLTGYKGKPSAGYGLKPTSLDGGLFNLWPGEEAQLRHLVPNGDLKNVRFHVVTQVAVGYVATMCPDCVMSRRELAELRVPVVGSAAAPSRKPKMSAEDAAVGAMAALSRGVKGADGKPSSRYFDEVQARADAAADDMSAKKADVTRAIFALLSAGKATLIADFGKHHFRESLEWFGRLYSRLVAELADLHRSHDLDGILSGSAEVHTQFCLAVGGNGSTAAVCDPTTGKVGDARLGFTAANGLARRTHIACAEAAEVPTDVVDVHEAPKSSLGQSVREVIDAADRDHAACRDPPGDATKPVIVFGEQNVEAKKAGRQMQEALDIGDPPAPGMKFSSTDDSAGTMFPRRLANSNIRMGKFSDKGQGRYDGIFFLGAGRLELGEKRSDEVLPGCTTRSGRNAASNNSSRAARVLLSGIAADPDVGSRTMYRPPDLLMMHYYMTLDEEKNGRHANAQTRANRVRNGVFSGAGITPASRENSFNLVISVGGVTTMIERLLFVNAALNGYLHPDTIGVARPELECGDATSAADTIAAASSAAPTPAAVPPAAGGGGLPPTPAMQSRSNLPGEAGNVGHAPTVRNHIYDLDAMVDTLDEEPPPQPTLTVELDHPKQGVKLGFKLTGIPHGSDGASTKICVVGVTPGGLADCSGMQDGQQILRVNGNAVEAVDNPENLVDVAATYVHDLILSKRKPGVPLLITVTRDLCPIAESVVPENDSLQPKRRGADLAPTSKRARTPLQPGAIESHAAQLATAPELVVPAARSRRKIVPKKTWEEKT
eukprot:m.42183 g.42183  ORF g.42183 m.42183 type:complete len:878 (+) comp14415_c0_seq1:1061-3694(+)